MCRALLYPVSLLIPLTSCEVSTVRMYVTQMKNWGPEKWWICPKLCNNKWQFSAGPRAIRFIPSRVEPYLYKPECFFFFNVTKGRVWIRGEECALCSLIYSLGKQVGYLKVMFLPPLLLLGQAERCWSQQIWRSCSGKIRVLGLFLDQWLCCIIQEDRRRVSACPISPGPACPSRTAIIKTQCECAVFDKSQVNRKPLCDIGWHTSPWGPSFFSSVN